MTTYRGWIDWKDGPRVQRIEEDGRRSPLPLRLDLDNHSPDVFAWGYGGSGPAQLALALLADVLDDDAEALRLHMRFKWRVTARLAIDEGWTMTRDQVLEHVGAIRAEALAQEDGRGDATE